MIRIDTVTRSFGVTRAVDELSFTVNPGEVFALLGPNGAGKTTTIKMILGLLEPDSGEIHFQGERVSVNENAYKAKIGYVPENGALDCSADGSGTRGLWHFPPRFADVLAPVSLSPE